MKFKSTTDKQLWVVDCGKYTVPVHATLGNLDDGREVWMVASAVYLDAHGFKALATSLNPFSINRYTGFWIIPIGELKATKAEGVTPERYYKGPKASAHAPTEVEIADSQVKSGVEDDFIRSVFQRTAVCDLKLLRLIWLTLCQEAPSYMMSTGKPIEFGWGRLCALPYRVTWKHNLLKSFPNIWRYLKMPKAESEAKLGLTEFPLHLISSAMLAVVKANEQSSMIRWTVEFDPNDEWYAYSDEIEKAALESGNNRTYLKRVASLLNRFSDRATDIFRSWVRQSTTPAGAVAKVPYNRSAKLCPMVRDGQVTPRSDDGLPAFIQTPPDSVEIRDSETGQSFPEEDEPVQELPVICLEASDVRSLGRVPGDKRTDGESGLSLLPGTGDDGGGKGLLGTGTGP